MSPLIIKQTNYNGPLDTLLQLIQKRKLHITDISLAQITDDYIKKLEDLKSIDYNEISNFIYIASTLILIKSKIMLPQIKISAEEDQNIEQLKKRLKMLQTIKELSAGVQKMFMKKPMFRRKPIAIKAKGFYPDKSTMTTDNIHNTALKIIKTQNTPKPTPKGKIRENIKLEHIIDHIRNLFRINKEITLMSATKNYTETNQSHNLKTITVINFLAILEMDRKGIISAQQEANDIVIRPQ